MLKLLNPQQQQEEALRRAAFKGDVAQVELLVVQGVDMNAPDHSGTCRTKGTPASDDGCCAEQWGRRRCTWPRSTGTSRS